MDRQATVLVKYGMLCARHGTVISEGAFDRVATDAAIHRANCPHTTQTLAICPNCGQWRRYGDCFQKCAARGFAPVAGPATLNM